MSVVISPKELRRELASEEQRFDPPMMIAGRAELLLISDSFVPEHFKPGREPKLQSWMRSTHEHDLSIRESQCVLGFLSDGTLMFNSVLPYGVPFKTHSLTLWITVSGFIITQMCVTGCCSTNAVQQRPMAAV